MTSSQEEIGRSWRNISGTWVPRWVWRRAQEKGASTNCLILLGQACQGWEQKSWVPALCPGSQASHSSTRVPEDFWAVSNAWPVPWAYKPADISTSSSQAILSAAAQSWKGSFLDSEPGPSLCPLLLWIHFAAHLSDVSLFKRGSPEELTQRALVAWHMSGVFSFDKCRRVWRRSAPSRAGLSHFPQAGTDSFTVPLKSGCQVPVLSHLLSACITLASDQEPGGPYLRGFSGPAPCAGGALFLHTILLPAEARRRSCQLPSSLFKGLTPRDSLTW